jgi:hypothetical protein
MHESVDCAAFRLIAIIPSERAVLRWNWNGIHLKRTTGSWDVGHWFSSSASDNRAEELRGRTCSRASDEPNAGSVAWIRQLHRSHENGPGAFSICVHRELVETLSYTEVLCTRDEVSMVHSIGNPCNPQETRRVGLRRVYLRTFNTRNAERQRIEESHAGRP